MFIILKLHSHPLNTFLSAFVNISYSTFPEPTECSIFVIPVAPSFPLQASFNLSFAQQLMYTSTMASMLRAPLHRANYPKFVAGRSTPVSREQLDTLLWKAVTSRRDISSCSIPKGSVCKGAVNQAESVKCQSPKARVWVQQTPGGT